MLFNSFSFLIFFPVVTLAFFVLPHRWRWILLLAASVYFYMAFVPYYILILAFTIIIDYFVGLQIEKTVGRKRKILLIAGLAANIAVLAFFKYFNFLNGAFAAIVDFFGGHDPLPFLNIILPIGLSFHTFQAMSYVIEVFRGRQSAERHFGIFSLYVMFYPQLVAGPIERPQNLLNQFYEKQVFSYSRIISGLKLMLWGLFKKVVIADRLAIIADLIFNDPRDFPGPILIIGVVFFAFQIFCDFSAYSDIAIGAARVMGFRLMKNFDRPYAARSMQDFWQRWHISLTSWFRDYIYIPLGGNRVPIFRYCLNIFLVFLISGLWHGAGWTFVAWGALHGFYIVFGSLTKKIRKGVSDFIGLSKLPKISALLKISAVFCLSSFAWIFFRANNFQDAFYIISHLFTGFSGIWNWPVLKEMLLSVGLGRQTILLVLSSVFLLEAVQYWNAKTGSIINWVSARPAIFRWGAYYALIAIVFFFGVLENRQFIYFQF